jgi:hypothetical protein
MIELVSLQIRLLYQSITGIDPDDLIRRYISFFQNNYIQVLNYYSGTLPSLPESDFTILENLISDLRNAINQFRQNENSFPDYDAWVLLENFEDILSDLQTVQVLPRFLRTANSRSVYTNRVKIDYTLAQEQSLENVSDAVIGSENFNEQWVELAIENDLEEEGYTSQGGINLKVTLDNSQQFVINSVANGIESSQDTYGIDIDRSISIVNSDLKVLTPRETIDQSADILLGLRRGDNPIFPDQGLNKSLILGRTIASISYPTIFRQIAQSFSTDDSFRSIAILDATTDQDAVVIDIKIETKAGDFLRRNAQL